MEKIPQTSLVSHRALRIHAAQHQEIMSTLPAKGTCWYCAQPLDAVRRFCSIHCRNDYFEEEVISALAGG